MKKLIAMLLLAACLLLTLTACGKKFTCDLCLQEKSGKQHISESMGIKVTVCDDCYKQLNALVGN